jgi:N,N'-diacetyllegionaminate synthase
MTRPLTIVAEAAQGFEGDPMIARLLVHAAAAATADIVKFQLVFADEIAVPGYQYYELFRQLEMSRDDWRSVADVARVRQIGLAFDVYGARSLALALECRPAVLKVHATDFFNTPLMDAALEAAPQTHLSVGGIRPEEVSTLIARYPGAVLDRLTLLVGFQAEPTATADNHLARLGAWRTAFPSLHLGFMDHADGDADEAAWLGVLALPYGVTVVEKHLTLGRDLQLEDFVSALDPEPFARYAERVRRAAIAIGAARLDLTERELTYRRKALKVVVAGTALPAGAIVRAADVSLLRAPLAPEREPILRIDAVVGQRITQNVEARSPIYRDVLG